MGVKQKIPTWKKKMYRILCDRQQKKKGKNLGKPPDVRCRNPGSNQGPLDLQSNALPTELFRLPITKAEGTTRPVPKRLVAGSGLQQPLRTCVALSL